MKVAVLGGGGVGACAALELSNAGCSVDVFERKSNFVGGASFVNEGKIHQGFIYAKDDPERTARLMAIGALNFRSLLSRWIDIDSALRKSTPFIYAILRGSMLTSAQVTAHFDACVRIFGGLQDASGLDYLGADERPAYRELSTAELGDIVDARHFITAYETTEYGVDPRPIAKRLASAIAGAAGVNLIASANVQKVERRADGKFLVHYADPQAQVSGPYDQVINALWEGRLAIDETMGLKPHTNWSYRHKFGNRVLIPLKPSDIASITCILGPFGDIVNYGDNGFYLSWYPSGMIAMSSDIAPPENWDVISRHDRLEVYKKSLRKWIDLCPRLGDLVYGDDEIDPVSGMIFAWGDTDIDHHDSRLHWRHEVGVESRSGYHSVNTGKYTLVPTMGMQAANRVLGRDDLF